MVRWEGGAKERLQAAALELFSERGYDRVTAAEIAARAGLTERTFFRQFADKPEVLFAGAGEYAELFLRAVRDSDSAAPMDLAEAALAGGAAFFRDERRPWSRARQVIIDADERLRERELLKGSSLGAALERELGARGVDGVTAAMVAGAVTAVHHLAFQQWIAAGETRSLAELHSELLRRYRAVLAA